MSTINQLLTLQAMQSGSGASERLGRSEAEVRAFQVQMDMATRLFAETQPGVEGDMGLDAFLTNDALMLDALSTISRLTGGAGPLHVSKPVVGYESKLPDISPAAAKDVLGQLAAKFESGKDGVAAVGYDRTGGTSYGKFQIASRTGTMKRFLKFLDTEAPDLAKRLRSSGPPNTGSKYGMMPSTWKSIAKENPERFEALQHQFISGNHYDPARSKILASTGVDVDSLPVAVQEVLFSTAVQHGASGAAKIFSRAIDRTTGARGASAPGFGNRLIDEVYDQRKGQFASSTARVRGAVASRLTEERNLARAMLSGRVHSRV